jgi:hypothetical protein
VCRRVDLEQRDVVVSVPADDRGLDAVLVLEADVDIVRIGRVGRLDGVGDHVRAGQDVPGR